MRVVTCTEIGSLGIQARVFGDSGVQSSGAQKPTVGDTFGGRSHEVVLDAVAYLNW